MSKSLKKIKGQKEKKKKKKYIYVYIYLKQLSSQIYAFHHEENMYIPLSPFVLNILIVLKLAKAINMITKNTFPYIQNVHHSQLSLITVRMTSI